MVIATMYGCPLFDGETVWKNHNAWSHLGQLTDTHPNHKTPNRWHHRGSTPSLPEIDPKCKFPTYFSIGALNPDGVVSADNEHAVDNPSATPPHATFSIFGDRVMTMHDLNTILFIYKNREETKGAELKYGPFDQRNINIAGLDAHNLKTWNHGWRSYGDHNVFRTPDANMPTSPELLQLGDKGAKIFSSALNRCIWELQTGDPVVHVAKSRIDKITRSSVTGYLKYHLVVGITRNTRGNIFYFMVNMYVDPNHTRGDRMAMPFVRLGSARYIGSSSTDKALLPPGKESDTLGRRGRPLHPLYARQSEMPSMEQVHNKFWQNLHKTRDFQPRRFYHDDMDDLPFWFKSRLRHQKRPTHMGYGSVASLYPDKSRDRTKCMGCV